MAKFSYVGTDLAGAKVKGQLDAPSIISARTALLERDVENVVLKEKKGILAFEITAKRIPREEVMHFSRQLAAFIRAGVPILDAIDTIREDAGHKLMQKALNDITEALRAGEPFSSSVAIHKAAFPPFYVDMLEAAEVTGQLDSVLDQLSKYIERDLEARRKIRSAMAYPILIMGMSLVTVIILTTFVLPRFKKFFASLDAELPLPTRILLGTTDFLGANWYFLIGGLFLLVFAIVGGARTGRGRSIIDKTKLKIPIVGQVVKYAIVERTCRVFSSMVQAGVPLPQALSIVAESSNNVHYERALQGVREQMLQGEGIARPIAQTELYPRSVTQMIRVGEDTGTLDQQLESAAQFFDQELDYKIKKLTTLFEPMAIIFMGLMVGFVAVALISAMYGIFNQVQTV